MAVVVEPEILMETMLIHIDLVKLVDLVADKRLMAQVAVDLELLDKDMMVVTDLKVVTLVEVAVELEKKVTLMDSHMVVMEYLPT